MWTTSNFIIQMLEKVIKVLTSFPLARLAFVLVSSLRMPGGKTFVLNGMTAAEDIETFLLELKL